MSYLLPSSVLVSHNIYKRSKKKNSASVTLKNHHLQKVVGPNVQLLSMYLQEKLKLQIEQFDKNLFARLLTKTPEAPLPSNKIELSNY